MRWRNEKKLSSTIVCGVVADVIEWNGFWNTFFLLFNFILHNRFVSVIFRGGFDGTFWSIIEKLRPSREILNEFFWWINFCSKSLQGYKNFDLFWFFHISHKKKLSMWHFENIFFRLACGFIIIIVKSLRCFFWHARIGFSNYSLDAKIPIIMKINSHRCLKI